MADERDELRQISASREILTPLVANARELMQDDGTVSAENREAYVALTDAITAENAVLAGAQAAYQAAARMNRDDEADAARLGLSGREHLTEATSEYAERFANAVSREDWDRDEITALRGDNAEFYALDGSSPAGSLLVPTETEKMIIMEAAKLSPLLRISNTKNVSWRSRNFVNGNYVGVAAPRKESAAYMLKEASPQGKQIDIGNYGFMMSHANEYLDDAFGLGQHISDLIAPVFAETVEEYAIKGASGENVFFNQGGSEVTLNLNNEDVPLGLLNETDEYVKNVDSAAAGAYSIDDITALRYGVRPQARNAGNWLTSSDFLQNLEGMKDADGRPLWQPSLQEGQPDRLRGRGIEESENLPEVGAGNVPALYGAFGRAHEIFIRRGVTVRRSQHYLFGNNSEALAVDIRWGSGVLTKGMLAKLSIG